MLIHSKSWLCNRPSFLLCNTCKQKLFQSFRATRLTLTLQSLLKNNNHCLWLSVGDSHLRIKREAWSPQKCFATLIKMQQLKPFFKKEKGQCYRLNIFSSKQLFDRENMPAISLGIWKPAFQFNLQVWGGGELCKNKICIRCDL